MAMIGMFLAVVVSVVAILLSLVSEGAQKVAQGLTRKSVDFEQLAADTWMMGKAHLRQQVAQGRMSEAEAGLALIHLMNYCAWIEAGNLPR